MWLKSYLHQGSKLSGILGYVSKCQATESSGFPHTNQPVLGKYIYIYPHMKWAQTYIVKIPLEKNRDLLLKYTTFGWLQLSRERWSSKKPWCFKDQVPQEVFRHHLPLPMRSPGFCNPFGGRTMTCWSQIWVNLTIFSRPGHFRVRSCS